MPAPTSRLTRLVRRAAGALVLALVSLVLTGCVSAKADLVVTEDDTISGTVTVGQDKAMAGMTFGVREFLADFSEQVPEATITDWAEGDYVGVQVTFPEMPLETFNALASGNGYSMQIVHDADAYVLSGFVDLDIEVDPTLAKTMDDPRAIVSVTFPGEITETNGQADGETVTWTLTAKDAQMSATAQDGSAPFPLSLLEGGWAPWALIVFGVVCLIGALRVVKIMRDGGAPRKKFDLQPEVFTAHPAAPAAAPQSRPHEPKRHHPAATSDPWADAPSTPRTPSTNSTGAAAAEREPALGSGHRDLSRAPGADLAAMLGPGASPTGRRLHRPGHGTAPQASEQAAGQPAPAPAPAPSPAPAPVQVIAPGWYPLTDGTAERYHDGVEWTASVRPAAGR